MIVLCVFFFFKQKTAYEMRISDWSSDVCSSDLLKTNSSDEQEAMGSYIRAAVRRWLKPWAEANNVDMYADGLRIYTTIDSRMQQIGRASCRERVCQYV